MSRLPGDGRSLTIIISDLHGNGIMTFEENSFVDFPSLQYLYVAPSILIASMLNLVSDISSNSLTYLGPNALAMPPHLVSLKMMAEPLLTFTTSAFGQSYPGSMFVSDRVG